ncbi:hypothetical protein HMI55_002703 [Coelomomyces lativittatus]|nr:hypothetical protein HMI55_002703 [Coelomomyces lativittatus]
MKYGSAQKMMTLSKPDTQQLWQGVVQNRLDLVEPILNQLLHQEPLSRYWPLKVYYLNDMKQPTQTSKQTRSVQDLLLSISEQENMVLGNDLKVKVQGLLLALHTPMEWIHRHLVSVDGWIHMFLSFDSESSLSTKGIREKGV